MKSSLRRKERLTLFFFNFWVAGRGVKKHIEVTYADITRKLMLILYLGCERPSTISLV